LLKIARKKGARISLGTDAHHPWQLLCSSVPDANFARSNYQLHAREPTEGMD
jgi:histidinol phosphatase-like PHP family hydrolase